MSCFIRALLRGLLERKADLLPHELLVKDFRSIVVDGLNAKILHPNGQTARQVCKHFLRVALENVHEEEKKCLSVAQKRIERGNLSEIIRKEVRKKSQKTDPKEAVVNVYLRLTKSLMDNRPYF